MPKQQLALADLSPIVEPLARFYEQSARSLPWRKNKDPYRVWVSEIMLQQTRVETVIPYFERFMKRLPTVTDLAEVSEEELVKLWEGLGYYRRVHAMQAAARVIVGEHGGVFPSEYDAILALPGVGPYTAGAIGSIAFSLPTPAVDGNVIRVLARLTEDGRTPEDASLKKDFTEALSSIYPVGECAGILTQSLMELGATVCVPNGAPKCDVCPLGDLCRAKANETQLLYPQKAQKKARRMEKMTVFLLVSDEKVALSKRGAGLLSGMWEFPNCADMLDIKEAENALSTRGIELISVVDARQKRHIFTHVEWEMQGYLVMCKNRISKYEWFSNEELRERISLPTAFRKWMTALPEHLESFI